MRGTLDLRAILRFAMPWFVAFALWSLLGCSPPREIVALDGETGAVRWRKEEAGHVVGGHANRIFVEREQEIVGLDAGSGVSVWKIPRASGARVIETIGPVPPLVVIESGGAVRRYEEATGKRQDPTLSLPIPAGEVRRIDPGVGGTAFVQTFDGRLLRIAPESSEPELLASTNAAIAPVSGFRGGPTAVLADGSLAAFDFRSGVELWRIAGLPAAHSLEADPRTLWLGGSQGALLAIDPSSGEIRFALPDAGTDARIVGRDPSTVVLQRDGRGISILDAESGNVIRSIPLAERVSSVVAISRSILVRRAGDGAVLGFDPETGDRRFISEPGPNRDVSVVVLDPRSPEASLLP